MAPKHRGSRIRERNPPKTLITILIVIAAVIVVAFSTKSFGQSLSILPPEEGPNIGIYGFSTQSYGTIYTVKNLPPSPWSISDSDPHNYIISHTDTFNIGMVGTGSVTQATNVLAEVGQSYTETTPYQTIDYWVNSTSSDQYTHVFGSVYIYHCDVSFSINPVTGDYVFTGIPVWIGLVTTVWDRTLHDQIGVKGQAWGAPISVYLESWQLANPNAAGDHSAMSPSFNGRFMTLYSAPGAYGTIDDVGIQNGKVQNSLGNTLAPDNRMQSSAYAQFTLSDFGITVNRGILGDITSKNAPGINFKLKIYYLLLGKFTYTKTQAEEWQNRQSQQYDISTWWGSLSNWLSDRVSGILTTFGAIGGIIFFVIIAVVFIIVLAVASSLRKGKVPMPMSMPGV